MSDITSGIGDRKCRLPFGLVEPVHTYLLLVLTLLLTLADFCFVDFFAFVELAGNVARVVTLAISLFFS